jgi:hypothetical protein
MEIAKTEESWSKLEDMHPVAVVQIQRIAEDGSNSDFISEVSVGVWARIGDGGVEIDLGNMDDNRISKQIEMSYVQAEMLAHALLIAARESRRAISG